MLRGPEDQVDRVADVVGQEHQALPPIDPVAGKELNWTPCPGQFGPEFKLVRLLQLQRFGDAARGASSRGIDRAAAGGVARLGLDHA